MILNKFKKKDYISPHIEVTWIDDTPICGISAEGKDQPWVSAKSSVVTHFDSDSDFDDDFDSNLSEGYKSYKVEW